MLIAVTGVLGTLGAALLTQRGAEDADRELLDAAKAAHRDAYSQAQMIAPDAVLSRAMTVHRAVNEGSGSPALPSCDGQRLSTGAARTALPSSLHPCSTLMRSRRAPLMSGTR